MKSPSTRPLGSSIASVHNGSNLFTSDAGSCESNIRCYLIENDMLEAIPTAEQPVLQHRHHHLYLAAEQPQASPSARQGKARQGKARQGKARQGKGQLIDASLLYGKLCKKLGDKNYEAGLWKKEHPRNKAVLVMSKEGLAERVNRILKGELLWPSPQDLAQAREMVREAVDIYNVERPYHALKSPPRCNTSGILSGEMLAENV